MRKIYDRDNRLIAIYDEQSTGTIRVLSPNYEYLGKVTTEGTFDKNNTMISRSREPGLLVEMR